MPRSHRLPACSRASTSAAHEARALPPPDDNDDDDDALLLLSCSSLASTCDADDFFLSRRLSSPQQLAKSTGLLLRPGFTDLWRASSSHSLPPRQSSVLFPSKQRTGPRRCLLPAAPLFCRQSRVLFQTHSADDKYWCSTSMARLPERRKTLRRSGLPRFWFFLRSASLEQRH